MSEPRDNTGGDTPEFRHLVGDITVQALREYDDGPLTPQQEQANNNGETDPFYGADENNLVVLDPNHDLMRRFQKRLKNHLLKREEKLTLETREAKYELDKAKQQRENLGVELYGLQQDLAKYQMFMEQEHDKYNETNQNRKKMESNLDKVRDKYNDKKNSLEEEQRKVNELQRERDNLKLKIFYMSNAKDDIRGDIAVIRRATEKVESDKSKLESEKQHQDLMVNRLEEKEQQLKEEIALFESHLANQLKESKNARAALTEALLETQAIEVEKKQLLQNWTSCLIGMKRRDEAYSQMNDAIRAQKQKSDTTISEIDSYKKSIIKEQEQNETLTIMKNNRSAESNNLNKQIKTCQNKMDVLKQEYSAYNRALKETEGALQSVNLDKNEKNGDVGTLQREIEIINQEKVKLEDEIFKKVQSKLTADKAAQYSDKLRKEQRDKIREIERSLAKVDNEIAKARLDFVQTESLNEKLEHDMNMMHAEIEDKNKIINKSEIEIKKRVLLIEQKQGIMDLFNKKIEQLIEKAGGVELGPLELEEKNLNKEIESIIEKIMELEQKWLREQNELVKLVKEKQWKQKELEEKKQEFTVLTTKKMRTERKIENENQAITSVNKSLDQLRLQLEKLNKYIYKESDTRENLEKSNVLAENDFVRELKEAEKDSMKLQERLERREEDKEKILNDIILVDEQIMSWEKRIQIAKEMKSAVDSDTGQGEINEMKFSIHRMKVRHSELMKEQERLLRDMDTSVSRRENYVTKGDAQTRNPKVVTQGKLQKDINDRQQQIKTASQDIKKLDNENALLRQKQNQLENILEEKQRFVQQISTEIENKENEIDELTQRKHENLDDLVSKQDKVKFYQQLKDGKYRLSNKSDTAADHEIMKQIDKLRTLYTIVNKLNEEFPNLQTSLRNVELSIQSRLNQEEDNNDKA